MTSNSLAGDPSRGTRRAVLACSVPYDVPLGRRYPEGIVLNLLQLWTLVRRGWLILLLFLAAGIGLGAAVSSVQPTLYSATSTGYVVAGTSQTVGDALAGKSLAAEKASTYVPLVQSRAVAEDVAGQLGLASTDQVAGSLTARTDGVIFRITATASTPELAAQMADAAIRATSVAANELETMTISGESSGNTVVGIVPMEAAISPANPISPDWTRNLVIGGALGLLAGFGLLVLRHTLDRRVRQASDVEELTGASALAIVPLAKALANTTMLGDGPEAEALRQLRTNLRFVNVDHQPRTIVITSPNAEEGKSTIAAHLAVALAESGQRTALVDADLRRPSQANRFGVDGTVGLTQVLAGSAQLMNAAVATSSDKLLLLPAGRIPPNPSELVGSDRMRDLIKHLSQNFTVIIDAPPLLPVTDPELLTVASDGAIMVVRAGKTRTEQVSHAARKLELVSGTLLGVVMNMVPRKDIGSVTYGYGYSDRTPSYQYSSKQPPTPVEVGAIRRPRRAQRESGKIPPGDLPQPVSGDAGGGPAAVPRLY